MRLHQFAVSARALRVRKRDINSWKQASGRHASFLVVLSSSLFSLAWCSPSLGWLLCIAIVPMLLIVESRWVALGRYSLSYIVVTLLLWNSLTLWWLYNAAFLAFVFTASYNTFCLTLPWLFSCCMRKWGGRYASYIGLLAAWLTLEYIHLSWECWELSFPWLNLGNGLCALAPWIQWYEYTGILGGSLWILGINILLYHWLFESENPFAARFFCCWFLIPLLCSVGIYCTYQERGPLVEAVVIQPNFDSYTEKDPASPLYVSYVHQIDRLLMLSQEMLSPATCVIVWPESAIHTNIDEAYIPYYSYMQPIFQFLHAHPAINLITGASSLCNYGFKQNTATAQSVNGQYVDFFNSIFHLTAGQQTAIYHKVKRLPGGEYIPYFHLMPPALLASIRKKFAEIGDINPSLAKGDCAVVFDINHPIKIAPVNCYESVYGSFVGDFVTRGATLLAVVTNDNWWGNTPIYHQHFQYSRLLAIAHRRSVMRSANTGISGFINQRGIVVAATKQLESAACRQIICANSQVTFYSLYGDYIGCISAWICLSMFLIMLIVRYNKGKKVAYA